MKVIEGGLQPSRLHVVSYISVGMVFYSFIRHQCTMVQSKYYGNYFAYGGTLGIKLELSTLLRSFHDIMYARSMSECSHSLDQRPDSGGL